MDRIVSFRTPPSRCEYLPVQQWRLHYELWADLRPADYIRRLKEVWRRIGPVMFQPACEECRKCLTLRIPVASFFFHDPDHHRRSLGTFHILQMMAVAKQRLPPHVYLGYYVEGCRSLEYKARFRPNEVGTEAGWEPFIRQ